MSTTNPSIAALRRAIEISERIASLESELRTVLAGGASRSTVAASAPVAAEAPSRRRGKKRKMSPEARARIVAAQKARWAKFNAAKGGTAKAAKVSASAPAAPAAKGKKKRKMSPEARARIVAAQKARWAKFNAARGK